MSEVLRRSIKVAALIPGLVKRRRSHDVVALIYHRIELDGREVDVSPATFDRHLRFLADRGLTIPIGRMTERGGVVVTFDDGYRDFYERGLPLLVKHGVPAVLYLQTGLVANGNRSAAAALNWSQLSDAIQTGLVTIGAHTHTHPNLSRATEVEAEVEMMKSKEIIEDKLGVECRHFAYPFGVASEAAGRAAQRLFDTAALGDWRINRRDRIDFHQLGRTPVLRSDGVAFFKAKVAGMLWAEALAYRFLGRGPWRVS